MTDSNQACFAGIAAPIFQEGLHNINLEAIFFDFVLKSAAADAQ